MERLFSATVPGERRLSKSERETSAVQGADRRPHGLIGLGNSWRDASETSIGRNESEFNSRKDSCGGFR